MINNLTSNECIICNSVLAFDVYCLKCYKEDTPSDLFYEDDPCESICINCGLNNSYVEKYCVKCYLQSKSLKSIKRNLYWGKMLLEGEKSKRYSNMYYSA